MDDRQRLKKAKTFLFVLQEIKSLVPSLLSALYKILIVEYVIALAYLFFSADGLKDFMGRPVGIDYTSVYAAGVLAAKGQATGIYNEAIHGHIQRTLSGCDAEHIACYIAWLYPPVFVGVAYLLSFIPYVGSLILYLVGGFAGYIAALRRLAPSAPTLMVIAFPGVFINLCHAQNGFISAALLGAGLSQLEKRPWLAGVWLGLLAYKPQFFILIPILLAVGRHGRACLGAVGTVSATVLLSWAAFGPEVWGAYLSGAGTVQHVYLETGIIGWHKLQSVFAMAVGWGGSLSTAYALQAVAATLAFAAAAWIWYRRETPLVLRASALCAAMFLITPYSMDYDLVILAVPLVLWVSYGRETFLFPYERVVLVVLWFLPLIARSFGTVMPLTPSAMAVLMAMCVYRLISASRAASEPTLECA